MEEAQRAINATDTEVESVENGIKLVKLMGRDNGMLTRSTFKLISSLLGQWSLYCCYIMSIVMIYF